MLSVYLVPLGRNRYELYTEPPDEAAEGTSHGQGPFRRQLHRLNERWREAVKAARRTDETAGRFARVRDWVVCRASETIAEQRTLWSLRSVESAQLFYPSDVTESTFTAVRLRLLAHARRHHGIWLVIDGLLFVVSGLFMLIPGPNVFAYYFGLRLIGHYLSWRGARQGLYGTAWHGCAEPALAELRELVDLSRESRAPRVAAIANGLHLPRLAAFFDRAAQHG